MLPAALSAQTAAPAMTAPGAGDTKVSSEPTFVVSKWKAKLYGFAEFDSMFDATQSYAEIQGGAIAAKPGTVAGDNTRFQETIRNSRIGFSLEAPEIGGVKAYGTVEGDFFGFDPNPGYQTSAAGAPASQPSEAGFYVNPTFRIRHSFVKITSPIIDVTAGQYWTLVGWDTNFMPATVALQGINGEIYQRTPQLRVGKSVDFGGGTKFSLAVAALRPYQRDSGTPDFQGGAHFEMGGWTGFKSTGGTGGGLTGPQLSVTGGVKSFRALKGAPANTSDYNSVTGSTIAVGALLPIIPATKESHANAMTVVVQASTGSGDNDLFTSTNMGATIGAPSDLPAGATYASTLDAGAAGYRKDTGALDTVTYQTMLVNLQYYTPIENVFFSGVYSYVGSDNAGFFAAKGAALSNSKYASAAIMWDPTPGARIGVEYVWTKQWMTDFQTRTNSRLNASFWFVF
jgi:hypothetical protein